MRFEISEIIDSLNESRDNSISEAVEIDVKDIHVEDIKPQQKDYDRAEGLQFRGRTFNGGGQPFASEAKKMAKLIKDPIKLVRRAKAVASMYDVRYYSEYFGKYMGPKEEYDVWTPFRDRLLEMGFSIEQVNKIAAFKR